MENVIDYLLRHINISPATLRNWQKEGVLPPFPREAEAEELFAILRTVQNAAATRLTARVNRSYSETVSAVSTVGLSNAAAACLRKAVAFSRSESLMPEAAVKAAALVLLRQRNWVGGDGNEAAVQNESTRIGRLCWQWIFPLTEAQQRFCDFLTELPVPFDGEGLGLLYQSLRTIGGRAQNGLFYTPKSAVPFLGRAGQSLTIYDPCCGSGALLMAALSPDSDSSCVFASDIDETALRLCEVNLALFFNDPDFRSHLFVADALGERKSARRFDVVICNPPWGSCRNGDENGDSFALILSRSFSWLKSGGRWIFFLPTSFLTVKRHATVRKAVLSHSQSLKLKLMGHLFPGVLSEAVLAEGEMTTDESKSLLSCDGIPFVESLHGECYPAEVPRAPYYFIEAFASPAETERWRRLYRVPHRRLGSMCGFLLGIVTGDNARLTAAAPFEGGEAIYRGCDLHPFHFAAPSRWIHFEKNRLRQAAPESLYRKAKIVYRFIGDRLRCVYDSNGVLILNSANAFYLKSDYSPQTLVCLLNSPFLSYLIRKRYHPQKILRSYLEDLPIPLLSEAFHAEFQTLYSQIVEEKGLRRETQATLTALSAKAFGLTSDEAAAYVE